MTGRLVYVVGPSGAGKDSVLEYARQHLAVDAGIVFARRFITRKPAAEGEQHIPLSASVFEHMLLRGGFALHWQANGLRYGIGSEILAWMNCGLHVVVNGSREYMPAALERFPDALVVCITAPVEIIRLRLNRRGRENNADIDDRIRRAASLTLASVPDVVTIVNDGTLQTAGETLLRLLLVLPTPGRVTSPAESI
jgi:ribose 1,5-bisphosphokinase